MNASVSSGAGSVPACCLDLLTEICMRDHTSHKIYIASSHIASKFGTGTASSQFTAFLKNII